jgi:hypothetical protein
MRIEMDQEAPSCWFAEVGPHRRCSTISPKGIATIGLSLQDGPRPRVNEQGCEPLRELSRSRDRIDLPRSPFRVRNCRASQILLVTCHQDVPGVAAKGRACLISANPSRRHPVPRDSEGSRNRLRVGSDLFVGRQGKKLGWQETHHPSGSVKPAVRGLRLARRARTAVCAARRAVTALIRTAATAAVVTATRAGDAAAATAARIAAS